MKINRFYKNVASDKYAVIVPAMNNKDLIFACLSSLKSCYANFPYFEVYIHINSDAHYGRSSFEDYEWIHFSFSQEVLNPSATRNLLIKKAFESGKNHQYFKFLDYDDLIDENYFNYVDYLFELYQNKDVELIYTSYLMDGENYRYVYPYTPMLTFGNQFPLLSTCAVKRELIKNLYNRNNEKVFNEDMIFGEDIDFFCRAFNVNNALAFPLPLVKYAPSRSRATPQAVRDFLVGSAKALGKNTKVRTRLLKNYIRHLKKQQIACEEIVESIEEIPSNTDVHLNKEGIKNGTVI